MAKTGAHKSTVPATDYEHLTSYSDPTTVNGKSQITQLSVKEFLTRLRLWDGDTVSDLGPDVGVECQRGVLNINTNTIKQKMFRHLLRGGVLPPLVVYNNGKIWQVVDGLQRTSVICEVLRTIKLLETGPETDIKKFAHDIITDMKNNNESYLTSDDFLDLPVAIQLWTDLTSSEWTQLFIILNTGQQKVNPRHLLEVDRSELRQIFVKWGLPVSTLREQKEHPGHRGRRSKKEIEAHPELERSHAFHFDLLINGLVAYASKDPHIKTSQTLHDDRNILSKQIEDIGISLCEADFKWICVDLYDIMREKYDKKHNLLNNDSFFVSTAAALGWSRQDKASAEHVEILQSELIELLEESESSDPMVLDDTAKGLNTITKKIKTKTSIGRKQRGIIFSSWKRFFRDGINSPDYPIDWEGGSLE